MSVRAIAIRNGPRPVLAAPPVKVRRRAPATPVRVVRRMVRPVSLRAQLADDRRLIGVKLILITLIGLAVMAMEVPW